MKNLIKSKFNSLLATSLVIGLSFAYSNAEAAKLKVTPKGDQFLFEQTLLNVKPGEDVTLTFDNTSNMPHNWVLVKPGSVDKVGQASLTAGAEKGWLALGPDVLAHTNMVEGKKSQTINFKAPTKPGDYPYICTFPGHYMVMKGILKVK